MATDFLPIAVYIRNNLICPLSIPKDLILFQKASHTITPSPPCFTVGTRFSTLKLSSISLHTRCGPSLKRQNLDSSLQTISLRSFIDQLHRSMHQLRRFCI